ncbi:MAG: hypothetical protein HQK92_01285 [Nitrospirae bacterium]|nr:hypothetical protein [Nitrospirota bacterium]
MKETCPGSKEITKPYPEQLLCVHCGYSNEIWSDENEMNCKNCNALLTREMKPTCIQWCPAAKECIGIEKYERLMKAGR